jgi:Fe-S-cluster-containing hydrogenase component 2
VCPSRAISRDDRGIIRVEGEKCDRCGMCVDACVIGAIRIDPETKTPLICDLCGGKPECVNWCKTKALTISTRASSTESRKKKWQYVLSEAKKNVEKWKLPRETLDQIKNW